MGDVAFDTSAYTKIVLHAAKYPECAVNGVLLADATNVKDNAKSQSLDIVDVIPLFHHSHYLSPMSEIALTQIETLAQENNKVIAGYYAGCENFRDNTIEKCPGQKIAEKIVEYFPSAVFVVVDNKKMVMHQNTPAIKVHKYSEGKWKPIKCWFLNAYVLITTSQLLQQGVHKDLIDFDNYLDDVTQDWTNPGIDKLVASMNAANFTEFKREEEEKSSM